MQGAQGGAARITWGPGSAALPQLWALLRPAPEWTYSQMLAGGEGPFWATLPRGETWLPLSVRDTHWARVSEDWRTGAP